jgi:hypothetical protein
MAGFLSENQKNNIKSIIDQIHDTFSREITVFKIGQRTAIASSPTYNSLYRQQSANSLTTEVSQTFQARIKYVDMSEELLPNSNAGGTKASSSGQDKIILPTGTVKIKVNLEGFNYVKEAKRIELDGRRFSIKSDGKPLGMFGPQYYEFVLTPIDE